MVSLIPSSYPPRAIPASFTVKMASKSCRHFYGKLTLTVKMLRL